LCTSAKSKYAELELLIKLKIAAAKQGLVVRYACIIDMHRLLSILSRQGTKDEALDSFREWVDVLEETHGSDHISTLKANSSPGALHWHSNRTDKAEEVLLQTFQRQKGSLGAYHVSTLETMDWLGELYQGERRLKNSEQM
jgi:hypothetical protein